MSRNAKAAGALAVLIGVLQMGARVDGIALPLPVKGRPLTTADLAIQAYNAGIESRNRGLAAEAKSAQASAEAGRARYAKTARGEYARAFDHFSDAAELDPAMPQAWNARGFIYRKLGDYNSALISYDHALALAPNFPDAIEYRAEACLALNRLDEAREAYLRLFALDRAQADLLMRAMIEWVATRKADPAGVDRAIIERFEDWINERATLARRTRLMGWQAAHRSW
ncbi:MAG: tetratricopeptide repeat protein [Vicinamibacterales bacterium]